MTGYWSICVPEAGTNLVTDPSCTALDIYNATSSTLTVDTTYARFGYMALKCVTSNLTDNEGITLDDITIVGNTTYTFSVYLRGSGTVNLKMISKSGVPSSTTTSADIVLSNTGWTRYSITHTSGVGFTTGVLSVLTSKQGTATFYADGFQLEAKGYMTTFISGSQPGCRWNGLYNASTSTRSANYRLGGHLVDIETTYGLRVRNSTGAGAPPLEVITQPTALQPGSIYLNDKYQERQLNLVLFPYGATIPALHAKRKSLWDLIKPEAYGLNDPFLLAYTGNTRTVYGAFRYAGGWEHGEINAGAYKIEQSGAVGLRLVGLDPFWYEDDQQIAALDYSEFIVNDYAYGRINGDWKQFGSGFNNYVNAIAIDYALGRVYFGGQFTTANGVTVNGIAYYDGATFQPLGAATKGVSGGVVNTIAIAPNGDVWAGGTFTAAGGSATKGLAKWAVAGTSAPTVYNTATTFTSIDAIAIDKDYRVYIGGVFTVFGGTANASYIAVSTDQGTNWAALTATVATGGTPRVYTIALDTNGTSIYFGGDFTAIGGVSNTARIAKYNRTAITALGTGVANNAVLSLAVATNGDLYAGGTFTSPGTYLARWNGSAWSDIAETAAVYATAFDARRNVLLYAGAMSFSIKQYALGSIKSNTDISIFDPINGKTALCVDKTLGDIYLGTGSTTVSPTSAFVSDLTTVTNSSTTNIYPIITVTATTTAYNSNTLYMIENQTTGQVLYFDLPMIQGEIITIDLTPGAKTLYSNYRGYLQGNPIPGSDTANFHLAPGTNTIIAFMLGTLTGASVIMRWQTTHNTVDGAA